MLTLDDIHIEDFDFIDFGASKGDSIQNAIEYLGGNRGLGIDLVPEKVEETGKRGFTCVQGDATAVDLPDKCVDFVVISHFLEHLPSEELVAACIASGIRLSRKFVFIKGPWFDADYYLNCLGLKFYWSDWKCHKTHLDIPMLHRILDAHPENQYEIFGKELIEDTDHFTVHPLESPSDIHHYRVEHGFKPYLKFSRPVFREILCVINTGKEDISFVHRLETPVYSLVDDLTVRKDFYSENDIKSEIKKLILEKQTRFDDYRKYQLELELYVLQCNVMYLISILKEIELGLTEYREGSSRRRKNNFHDVVCCGDMDSSEKKKMKKLLEPYHAWSRKFKDGLKEPPKPREPRWSKLTKTEIEKVKGKVIGQIEVHRKHQAQLVDWISGLRPLIETCNSAELWTLIGRFEAWQHLQQNSPDKDCSKLPPVF